jgi:hypothetical protein
MYSRSESSIIIAPASRFDACTACITFVTGIP